MKLDRQLAFLDIEATGLKLDTDRMIELSIIKLIPDGENPHIQETKTWHFNPGVPIHPKATEAHGYTDEDVKRFTPLSNFIVEIGEFIEGCDFAGFNSNRFDIPMLFNEFKREGYELDYQSRSLIDVGNIFKINEERTLSAAVKFYCNREHEDAHGAKADVQATIDVFVEQLTRYEGKLPDTVQEMALYSNYGKPFLDIDGKFSTNEDGEYIYNFGPHKDTKIKDELGFLTWMLAKDFSDDTKSWGYKIRNEINKPEPTTQTQQTFLF